jgi:hypothetical protein
MTTLTTDLRDLKATTGRSSSKGNDNKDKIFEIHLQPKHATNMDSNCLIDESRDDARQFNILVLCPCGEEH